MTDEATDHGNLTLIDPPRYRHTDDGGVELWDVRRSVWQRIKPWSAPILEALERGTDYEALKKLALDIPVSKDPVHAEGRLKLFLFSLHRLGHIELPRPATGPHPRYTVLRELGRGGVAVADLARDEETGEHVVVKRAWDFLQPYETTESAVRHESEVLKSLQHPGIVRLRDQYLDKGHLHLVRDHVEGREFTTYQGSAVTDDVRYLGLARRLVDIVDHVHEKGYLLLDLRPANFYETEGGKVILLDVGQCRTHDEGTIRLDRPVGSRGFVTPEMTSDLTVTRQSDLYGLGMLLLFLRSGILTRKKPKARRIERTLGPDDPWVPLLISMTSQDPAERPRDAAAVRAAMQRLDP